MFVYTITIYPDWIDRQRPSILWVVEGQGYQVLQEKPFWLCIVRPHFDNPEDFFLFFGNTVAFYVCM